MIEFLGSVVQHSHNVRIIMFIVIVERIEEHSQTIPAVRRSEHISVIVSLRRGVPESLRRYTKS